MITFYKVMYIAATVLGAVLVIASIYLFFRMKICSVIKELKNTKQEEDIKKLLKNTVLLNPQIQDDIPNIEGYNDLLAYYFKVLKEEEKKRQQLLNKIEQQKRKNALKLPTYNQKLIRCFNKEIKDKKYNIEIVGTSMIINN